MKNCIQITLFMCTNKNSLNWYQHAIEMVLVYWSFNAEVSAAHNFFFTNLKWQTEILTHFFGVFFTFRSRKMETKQMFVEWFIPCYSSGYCRINAWTNHTNLRWMRHLGFWWSLVEPHHAIHTSICCSRLNMGSGKLGNAFFRVI